MSTNDETPRSLGMGGEAVQGVHGAQAEPGEGDAEEGEERAGSEPLPRNREHVPSYGGAGGAPRTSSDQRELPDSRGDQGAKVARGEVKSADATGANDAGRSPINPS